MFAGAVCVTGKRVPDATKYVAFQGAAHIVRQLMISGQSSSYLTFGMNECARRRPGTQLRTCTRSMAPPCSSSTARVVPIHTHTCMHHPYAPSDPVRRSNFPHVNILSAATLPRSESCSDGAMRG